MEFIGENEDDQLIPFILRRLDKDDDGIVSLNDFILSIQPIYLLLNQ